MNAIESARARAWGTESTTADDGSSTLTYEKLLAMAEELRPEFKIVASPLVPRIDEDGKSVCYVAKNMFRKSIMDPEKVLFVNPETWQQASRDARHWGG